MTIGSQLCWRKNDTTTTNVEVDLGNKFPRMTTVFSDDTSTPVAHTVETKIERQKKTSRCHAGADFGEQIRDPSLRYYHQRTFKTTRAWFALDSQPDEYFNVSRTSMSAADGCCPRHQRTISTYCGFAVTRRRQRLCARRHKDIHQGYHPQCFDYPGRSARVACDIIAQASETRLVGEIELAAHVYPNSETQTPIAV